MKFSTKTARPVLNTAAKSDFERITSKLQLNYKSVKALCLRGATLNGLRHDSTNYDDLCKMIDNCGASFAERKQLIHDVQNFVNKRLDAIKNEVIFELLNQNRDLTAQVAKLNTMLIKGTKVSLELREELSRVLTTKDAYVQFIADLCDVSFDEAAEVA